MVNVWISEKTPFNKVVFTGILMQSNDFSLKVYIEENPDRLADVSVNVAAYLNPLLRMMVSGTVKTFLERLIGEMEEFDGWNKPA